MRIIFGFFFFWNRAVFYLKRIHTYSIWCSCVCVPRNMKQQNEIKMFYRNIRNGIIDLTLELFGHKSLALDFVGNSRRTDCMFLCIVCLINLTCWKFRCFSQTVFIHRAIEMIKFVHCMQWKRTIKLTVNEFRYSESN